MSNLRKLKTLNPQIETLASQFTQKCFVSGTAKGKAKLKSGQVLKRSTMSIKKGTAQPDPASKGPGPRKSEFEQMVDDCLRATAPLRRAKPKERAREAMREKMGLLSESRKLEIQQLKKQSKMKDNDEPGIIGTPGLDLISLGLVNADEVPKYKLTVEDGKKLAKEYSRVLMRKHRARQAAETNLLRCKKEAIEALPEELKVAALVPDLAPFPMNRFMATLTPPIDGFVDKINEAAKRKVGREKHR
ncbi:Copper ion binding [Heracleum sosnowskyi]|uniref:Copper ion binding n=1 Tax=Heracleum sosnowskyi TaxID=360622 RepID=A0AAD8I3E8_9APIA|nr:Copper ion binding [Heracleum sosnowskyi]